MAEINPVTGINHAIITTQTQLKNTTQTTKKHHNITTTQLKNNITNYRTLQHQHNNETTT